MPTSRKPPPRPRVVIATRGSTLALWQADYVTGLLKARGLDSEKLIIKTTADRIQDRFLHEIGGKGLFVKELEEALKDGRADLAVHSLKDMTARLAPNFVLAAVLARHQPTDVMIFRRDVAARLTPPQLINAAAAAKLGALRVGTGSLRRQALLAERAPALQCTGVRGNVDTRLKKLAAGDWDALILAEASLERLGIKDVAAHRLDPDWFIPCAAQGALAIEARADDPLSAWLGGLACPETTLAVSIEREILARLGGDCNMPFGCLARRDAASGLLTARAVVLAKDGTAAKAAHEAALTPGDSAGHEAFVLAMIKQLAANGAGKILAGLGIAVPPAFAASAP